MIDLKAIREKAEAAKKDGSLMHRIPTWVTAGDGRQYLFETQPNVVLKLLSIIEVQDTGLKESCYCDDPAYRSVEPCAACDALEQVSKILTEQNEGGG